MPRKKRVYKNKKHLKPDPKFGNLVLSRFINQMMRHGKKATAQRMVYEALDLVSNKTKLDPLDVFDTAMRNVSPALEVKAKRIGGANYQIAIEVRGDRKETLAMRWIRDAVRKDRGGKPSAERLADELILASKKEGAAMKKREDVQRMAEANRAFSHFAR